MGSPKVVNNKEQEVNKDYLKIGKSARPKSGLNSKSPSVSPKSAISPNTVSFSKLS